MRPARTSLAVALACASAAGCAGGLVFVTHPEEEVAAVANPHDYRGRPLCQRCHPDRSSRVPDPVGLCLRCHQREHGIHPQGHRLGVPIAARPEALPLWQGGMACHTCHDPHDVRAHRAGLRMSSTPLCLQCHRQHG